MEISKEKKDWIWAIVTFLIITLLFAISVLPFYYGMILGLFAGFFMLIKKEENRKEYSGKLGLILFPVFSFVLFEMLNVNGITVFMYPFSVLLNLLFFYLIEIILLLITKKGNIAIITSFSIWFVLALINSYVVEFRGYGFSYTDIYSIKTAIHIASEYNYRLTESQLIASIITWFIIKIASKNNFSINTRKPILIVSSILGLVVYLVILSCTPFLLKIGIEPKFYYDHPNGFIVNTLGQVQVINQDRTPENYSTEAVDEILENIDITDSTTNIMPQNVICIMNEALADLSVYENFDIGYDPLEYIHSLKENTISGYVYSSVFGGTTVVSEYEFLSNNSALLFGSTMSPYSTFVDSDSYSLAKQLNENGYHSTFMHPYKRISYNRPYAYDVLGFNEQYYDMDLLKEFGQNYWTDSGLYDIIKSKIENEEKSFIFAVTVQNHSPFSLMDDFNLELPQTTYGELTNKYLSLVKESDKAVQELIEYYKNSNEPTIIVLFGDHQPKLDSDFFETINGCSLNETLKDESLIAYKTPFMIWANYDIEEQENVEVSINYLSTLVLEQTGIEKTSYQHFLTSIRDDLPIITANGIIDKDGNYYETIDDLPNEHYALAHQYQILEYNMIFDKERNGAD